MVSRLKSKFTEFNLEDILFSGKIKNFDKKVMFCNNKSIIFDLKSEQ